MASEAGHIYTLLARHVTESRSKIKHRCKKTFFFYFGHVFLRFSKLFYFPNVFYFKKNVGKVQSGKQVNKKHFQNNSNEIDL